MKELLNRNEISPFSWLDDCVQHIYYYENVVLKRAKNDRRFTESEIIDIIGKCSGRNGKIRQMCWFLGDISSS